MMPMIQPNWLRSQPHCDICGGSPQTHQSRCRSRRGHLMKTCWLIKRTLVVRPLFGTKIDEPNDPKRQMRCMGAIGAMHKRESPANEVDRIFHSLCAGTKIYQITLNALMQVRIIDAVSYLTAYLAHEAQSKIYRKPIDDTMPNRTLYDNAAWASNSYTLPPMKHMMV